MALLAAVACGRRTTVARWAYRNLCSVGYGRLRVIVTATEIVDDLAGRADIAA
jgi:hypothetical protein